MLDLPDPLFETFVVGKKLCLVCGQKPATSALWAGSRPIAPVCKDCSVNWNMHGYTMFRRVKPVRLVAGILKHKLTHPFQAPSLASIWHDVAVFKEWARKMKRFMKKD